MTTKFWKSSLKDNAKNGTVLGAVFGFAIIFGNQIYNFISSILPNTGSFTLKIYILIAAAILGYSLDKW